MDISSLKKTLIGAVLGAALVVVGLITYQAYIDHKIIGALVNYVQQQEAAKQPAPTQPVLAAPKE